MSSKFTFVLMVFLTTLVVTVHAEQKRSRGGRPLIQNIGVSRCPQKTIPSVSIPSFFDARVQWPDCISHPGNQKDCGCCWAWAATRTLTDRVCIASNGTRHRLLSPQYQISCDHTCYGLQQSTCQAGCDGGFLDLAWIFLNQTGVVPDACIPFTDTTGICPATVTCENGTSAPFYKAQACYSIIGVTSIQSEILQHGPVEAGMNIYDDFESYSAGEIYVRTSNVNLGGHAVRIIGWGTESGLDYWLCMNQWGGSWGDNGTFKIRRGTNEAGIESAVLAALPNFNGVPVEFVPYPNSASTNCFTLVSVLMTSLFVLVFIL